MTSLKSCWNKLGILDNNILDTSKAYYGKYLYRAELDVPCAYYIRYIKVHTITSFKLVVGDMQVHAKNKIEISPQYTSTWSKRKMMSQINANAMQLWTLNESCNRYNGKIKTRKEDNKFQIYTETEEQLLDVLSYSKKHISSHVISIHRPKNEKAKILLADKVIFVKNPKFNFKVITKRGNYTAQDKNQINAYLDNFKNDIILSKGLKHYMIQERSGYVTGSLYVNDLSVLTFLQMISPKFIRKIYKLEKSA